MKQRKPLTFEEKVQGWGGIICIGLVLWAVHSCNASVDKANEERQAEAVDRAEKEKSQRETFAREERAKDEAAASEMFISYDEYIAAKKQSIDAWVACKRLVDANARWGTNWDFLPGNHWRVEKGTKKGYNMRISGNDVKLKNGFNAEQRAWYYCDYDMRSKVATFDGFGKIGGQ